MMNDQMKTGIHRALKLPAEIPVARVGSMVMSWVIGGSVAAIGVGLLYLMARLAIATAVLSIPLLVVGTVLVGGGFNFASKQLLAASFRSLASPIQAIKRALKNGDSNG